MAHCTGTNAQGVSEYGWVIPQNSTRIVEADKKLSRQAPQCTAILPNYRGSPADRIATARRAITEAVIWMRFDKGAGPPRIRYLAQVFPDALFVHVVRDGRAVVHSGAA